MLMLRLQLCRVMTPLEGPSGLISFLFLLAVLDHFRTTQHGQVAESGLSSERGALAGSVASGDEADGHRGIRVGEAAHPGQLVD